MAKTRSKTSTDNEQEAGSAMERPLKRPKVASDSSQDVDVAMVQGQREGAQMPPAMVMTDDEDDVPQAMMNVPRASDLYLDTVSGMFHGT